MFIGHIIPVNLFLSTLYSSCVHGGIVCLKIWITVSFLDCISQFFYAGFIGRFLLFLCFLAWFFDCGFLQIQPFSCFLWCARSFVTVCRSLVSYACCSFLFCYLLMQFSFPVLCCFLYALQSFFLLLILQRCWCLLMVKQDGWLDGFCFFLPFCRCLCWFGFACGMLMEDHVRIFGGIWAFVLSCL